MSNMVLTGYGDAGREHEESDGIGLGRISVNHGNGYCGMVRGLLLLRQGSARVQSVVLFVSFLIFSESIPESTCRACCYSSAQHIILLLSTK